MGIRDLCVPSRQALTTEYSCNCIKWHGDFFGTFAAGGAALEPSVGEEMSKLRFPLVVPPAECAIWPLAPRGSLPVRLYSSSYVCTKSHELRCTRLVAREGGKKLSDKSPLDGTKAPQRSSRVQPLCTAFSHLTDRCVSAFSALHLISQRKRIRSPDNIT